MTSGLYPFLAWLRERVDEREKIARDAMTLGSGAWERTGMYVYDQHGVDPIVYDEGRPTADEAEHIATHDPRDALAQCAAHTALLDLIEKTSGPDIAVKSEDDSDAVGAMFVALKMDEFALAVARAYQHHPEYAEQLAAFAAQPHQIKLTRARDELAERRSPPSAQ